RKRVLVGGHNYVSRRIVKSRELFERNEPVPLEIPRAAIHRNIAIVGASDRQAACRVISDVAVDIGINEILTWSGKPLQPGHKLIPIARAVDVQKRELERTRFRRCPTQRQIMASIVDHNWAVPRHPLIERFAATPLNGDNISLQASLFQRASKQ